VRPIVACHVPPSRVMVRLAERCAGADSCFASHRLRSGPHQNGQATLVVVALMIALVLLRARPLLPA